MDDLDGFACLAWARFHGADLLYIVGAEAIRGSFLEGTWFGLRLTRGGAECVKVESARVAGRGGSGSGSGRVECSVRA